MRSPEDMKIIEIDITNACVHNCSNCTRMCGHHVKPFFMSWDTFKRAVDSLDGFEGGVGMMGGEPTLHPEFERFAEYLNSKYEQPKENNYFISPTAHFMRDRKLEERNLTYTYKEKNGLGQRVKGPVLFSSLASNYHKYYEIIQDVFRFQGINDHITPCFHQPIMVNRTDMGISDEEWVALRDHCWVQNTWSASITPKGCFFCEVAGALDMLFDGPGGWPIEKNWWKRKPEDFKDQLHWCELCGIALNTRSRNANEEIDDVSVSLFKKLEGIKSPKLRKGQVHVYEKDELPTDSSLNRKSDYHDNNMNRLSNCNQTIYSEYHPIIFISDESDTEIDVKNVINNNVSQTKKLILFVAKKLIPLIEKYINESNYDTQIIVRELEDNYGQNLNTAHKITGDLSNNIILTSGVKLDQTFWDYLKQYAINPGTYHYLYSDTEGMDCKFVHFINSGKKESFVLYNPYAKALRRGGFDRIAQCRNLIEFSDFWDDSKKVIFNNELLQGQTLVNSIEYESNCRYVIFGTGTYGKKAFEEIMKIGSEVSFYCDSSLDKQNKILNGIRIYAPTHLSEARDTFDKVVIAALAYNDIREAIINNGLTDDDIVAPIF